MAESNTQTAAVEKIPSILAEAQAPKSALVNSNLDILADETSRFAARMKYLAMAVNSIADGSSPAEPERGNCVAWLLDTLEYLGDAAHDAAENLEQSIRRVMKGQA